MFAFLLAFIILCLINRLKSATKDDKTEKHVYRQISGNTINKILTQILYIMYSTHYSSAPIAFYIGFWDAASFQRTRESTSVFPSSNAAKDASNDEVEYYNPAGI